MTMYRAYLDFGKHPLSRDHVEIELPTLRGVTFAARAKITAQGVQWAELELPRKLKLGHYFSARCADAGIEIYKVRG